MTIIAVFFILIVALGINVWAECGGTCQVNWPAIIMLALPLLTLAFCLLLKINNDLNKKQQPK